MTDPGPDTMPSPPPDPTLDPQPDPTPEPTRSPRAAQGETPIYKGEPLDSDRGPGLGCFWIQAITLGVLLILTPLTVAFAWPPLISAALLIITLILLLFTGQTVIFLLRLVAADKRGRRTPRSASARKTVGMLEDEAAAPTPDGPATVAESAAPGEPEAGPREA
jgi:hypothetical protein